MNKKKKQEWIEGIWIAIMGIGMFMFGMIAGIKGFCS